MSDQTANNYRGAKVLVVDDEAPIRLLIRFNLESEGFVVVEAENGEVAVEMAGSEQPDAIFLDVMMPRKDGWTVAEELLSSGKMADVPIIFLTARADLRDHQRGLDTGAFQYMTKPFDPRILGALVRESLDAAKNGTLEHLRGERIAAVKQMKSKDHPS